jgi:hypothetical protein
MNYLFWIKQFFSYVMADGNSLTSFRLRPEYNYYLFSLNLSLQACMKGRQDGSPAPIP